MLKQLWRKWLGVSEALGNVVARIFLAFFYLVVLAAPAFLLSFVFDKVGRGFGGGSYFIDEKTKSGSLKEAREM